MRFERPERCGSAVLQSELEGPSAGRLGVSRFRAAAPIRRSASYDTSDAMASGTICHAEKTSAFGRTPGVCGP